MSEKKMELSIVSSIESVDKLFLHFLVGKNEIYKDEGYNDGLSEADEEKSDGKLTPKDGWNQRILLDVEKQRVLREKENKLLNDKRNALLRRYFQQSLLKIIDIRLKNSDAVILDRLLLRESTIELLIKLLSTEARYSILATLLESDIDTRKRLLSLVSSPLFMSTLGGSPRKIADIQTAIGLIGNDALRYLIPAILFKYRANVYSQHNALFSKKLWRYGLTLGQTCTALMIAEDYRRPHEGMLLSMMVNFAHIASYQQYLTSFKVVRHACLEQAREKGEKQRHDFFYDIQTDEASLQALLVSHSNLKLSLELSEKLFLKSFPHLVTALREEVTSIPFEVRSKLGRMLFQAMRFAKYDQLRTARLFKSEWLENYLRQSQIPVKTYKSLLRQELFRFKPTW